MSVWLHKCICGIIHMESMNGLLARYVKLWVAHAPGMPGTFYPPPRVSDPDTHHGTCVTYAPWCLLGSLSSGFVWSRGRGKGSQRMRNPQFYAPGKRPIGFETLNWVELYALSTWRSIFALQCPGYPTEAGVQRGEIYVLHWYIHTYIYILYIYI